MNNLKFGEVKLRKTQISHDASAPKVVEEIDEKAIDSYQNTVLDINIEFWIDLIRDYTFETVFLPLTLEDALMFENSYEVLVEKKQHELPSDLQAIRNNLVQRLQETIDKVKGNDTHVFVKTSCRSAKDTPIYNQQFRTLYRNFLQKKQLRDENDKIVSLLEAGTQLLKVNSADAILDNFCRSERVSQDMIIARKHPSRFQQNFVVRKWTEIDVDMEFRGFVCNGKLNALSQYNHLAFFPRLPQMKEEIEKRITTFWEKSIKHSLEKQFSQYVIDFALYGPDYSSILIIELNPFLSSTDGALFSWQTEKNILENGPFEFRVRDKKAAGAKSLISVEWREVLEQETV